MKFGRKKMTEVKIGNRVIGENHPPLVLAEVGINHEGSIDKAISLIDAAIKSGAEAIKFQCHITDQEMIETNNNKKVPGIFDLL